MLFAQVSYFSFRATVTVNDPFGIQRMEILSTGRDAFVVPITFLATSHRFFTL
ncbi:MAG: hypothetical protein ACLR6J_07695 [Parabacteroides merdae]